MSYTTVKIVSREIPGGLEYQVQEKSGFALSEWTGIYAARRAADAIEFERTASNEQRGWGSLEQS